MASNPPNAKNLRRGTLPPFISAMHTPFWDECVAQWDELAQEAV
jgi:hypothetical protein